MTAQSDTTPSTARPGGVPFSTVDLHDDAVLLDPYPVFAELRELGPVVWMDRYGYYALPRYPQVAEALSDWDTFTSAEGVGFNDVFNGIKETSLHSHGDRHDEIRQVEGCPIKKEPLRELRPELESFATELVEGLRSRQVVDGLREIAMRMPIDVVTSLVGIDEAGRENFLLWGKAGFDSEGPIDAHRTVQALETMGEYYQYAAQNFPHNYRPDGWADQLFRNGTEAGWDPELAVGVMNDYIYPSIDSTIAATGIGLLLFAQYPDQWDKLRADRSLLQSAISEIVRLASPVQFFTRYVTRDTEVEGVTIPGGSRVIVMYGSANRDDRVFSSPDTFDITRNPALHLGWGRGKHACLGKPLARLEMVTLFNELADHVDRFHVQSYEYAPNNIIRSLGELKLTIDWTK